MSVSRTGHRGSLSSWADGMTTSLLVISDREPLAWLLRTSSFAIPAARAESAPRPGTTLLLYTTRGCHRNPGRDRGLVMGLAQATSDPRRLSEPVTFRGHEYVIGLDLDLQGVCRVREGVQLGPLQRQLDLLPSEGPWSYPLRRSAVPLSDPDATLIRERLVPLLRPVSEVLPAYERAARLLKDEENE